MSESTNDQNATNAHDDTTTDASTGTDTSTTSTGDTSTTTGTGTSTTPDDHGDTATSTTADTAYAAGYCDAVSAVIGLLKAGADVADLTMLLDHDIDTDADDPEDGRTDYDVTTGHCPSDTMTGYCGGCGDCPVDADDGHVDDDYADAHADGEDYDEDFANALNDLLADEAAGRWDS